MSLFSLDYNQLYKAILPPKKRLTNFLAWGAVKVKPIQYLHDLFFNTYIDGFTGNAFNELNTFVIGERVRYKDHSVYEALVNIPTVPNAHPPGNTNWKKVQEVWVGLRERSKYNGQKIVLEYGLNKWFDTVFRYAPSVSDIYITNNTLYADGFIVATGGAYSSAVPKNELYGDVGIGATYTADQNAFTIFVPLAVANDLTIETPDVAPAISITRENIIRSFADKYTIAGVQYNVVTY